MISEEELDAILNDRCAEWIKVKEFKEIDAISHVNYCRLLEHHKEETAFLINKCKELAKQIKNNKYSHQIQLRHEWARQSLKDKGN